MKCTLRNSGHLSHSNVTAIKVTCHECKHLLDVLVVVDVTTNTYSTDKISK